ncbi:MAG: type II toxin-antitoxin system RelE/ParE family toxin [Candidatus Eisenbacteria bacterium]|nr:type II toxin-antitoxin system RelE/ParE family toxin [Candidatus Eisenbacteria bacterium]
MAYSIVFKKSVSRDLAKLRKEEARRILRQLEKDLSDDPGSYPVLKGKFAGLRKYRVGSYRVIYTILGRDVLVLRVGHRGEVYKQRNTRTLTRPRT